jgi:hypothetical protein
MNKQDSQKGQVMVLAIVVLTAMILSTTTLAAFLALYHLRSAGDMTHSAQALYAADAGVECELFNSYRSASLSCGDEIEFNNGVSVKTKSEGGIIRSIGSRGRSARAFEVNLNGTP